MSEKCKLICMSFDGDYVTERAYGENTFESVNVAWEHSNDMGSKWYFYPFHFVVTESGLTIKDAPSPLAHFIGKRVSTIAKRFEEFSKLPELQNAGVDEFIYAVA